MEQNGVVCQPGRALLFFIFRFEYLFSGPKSYRDFRETGPCSPYLDYFISYPFSSQTFWSSSLLLAKSYGLGALKAKQRAVAIVYFQIDFFVNLTEHLPLLHQGMQPLSVPYKFLTVFDNETYRSLSSLRVSKAVGPAGNIPKRLFKNFEPELAPITRGIYKQSLREGYQIINCQSSP